MRSQTCLVLLILGLLTWSPPAQAQQSTPSGSVAQGGGGRPEGAAGVEEEITTPLLQDHPIIRPEDVEGGHQQVDVLFNVETYREPGKPYQTNVPVLYRLDTGKDTEFRVAWGGLAWDRNRTGVKDLSLGVKWNIQESNPSWGAIFVAELNTGSAGFGDPAIEPLAVLSYGYQWPSGWDMTLNAGLQSMVDGTSRDRYWQGSYAGQVGYNFNEEHRVAATFSGYGPDQDPGGIHRATAHLGYNWNATRHSQLTVVIHRGLSVRGTDWGWTLGWSQRY